MNAKSIKRKDFERLLKIKKRGYEITDHAKERAQKRYLLIETFKKEIESSKPVRIFEQEHETSGERKFDVYYLQTDNFYHRYIIVLNDNIRLISLMRVSKDMQRKIIGK